MEPWTLENGERSGEIGTFPDIFFSLSSIEGLKQRMRPEIFAKCIGQCLGESTVRKWVSRYKEDRFDISDTPRSGRPSGLDEDRLNTLIRNDPRQCRLIMNCKM